MAFLRIVLICGLLIEVNTSVPALQEVIPYPDPSRFEDSIKGFEAQDMTNPLAEGAIVAIGSSSMRLWATIHRDLAPLNIIHRGFGGSTMNDALHFAGRIILPYRPRAVLLYEGENDVEIGIPPDTIAETFYALVAKIHQALPDTRIYVIAIKPSVNRWRIRSIIKKANELLREACEADPRLSFIDIVTPMLNENHGPRSELFAEDQVHMNEKGYSVWKDTIRPVLMKNEAKIVFTKTHISG